MFMTVSTENQVFSIEYKNGKQGYRGAKKVTYWIEETSEWKYSTSTQTMETDRVNETQKEIHRIHNEPKPQVS